MASTKAKAASRPRTSARRSTKKKATKKKATKRAAPRARNTAKKKTAKKKATKKLKRNFTTSMRKDWRGGAYKVLNFTDTSLVSVLQSIMSLHEDYSRRARGMRWYLPEAEVRVKWRRLEKLVERHPKHKNLLAPLREYIDKEIQTRMALFQANVDEGFVTFDDLWLLYYEDQEIVYDDEGALMAGTIQKCKLTHGWGGTRYIMEIKVISHDGENFTEVDKTVEIPAFESGELITNLPVRPLTGALKLKLAERGDRVVNTIKAGSSYVYYGGECIVRSWWGTKRYRADGRCMLDPKTHKKMNENYAERTADDYYETPDKADDNNRINEVRGEDLWRVAPWIPGFSFAAKQWGEFNIEDIANIPFNTDAYDQLVLPSRTVAGLEVTPKKMIRSLVEHGAVGFTDVIADKGGGIIFLLHGPPGTGKTLTAEAIADLLKRPLYSVSVGELGTNTKDLEKNLRMVLEVATLWNAVLLIDEADIFLEKRTPRDIERNALVAIFLRMLEYYQGVMFLTTNRVQQFDPAFNSRLSIALHYPEHDSKNRKAIWSNLMMAAGIDPEKFDVDALAEHDVNGRQIKHSIRIGLSLAANEKRKVVYEDFLKTLVLAQHFNDQLGDAAHFDETPVGDEDRPVQVDIPAGENGESLRQRTTRRRGVRA
jgi:hypothetical protein